MNQPVRLLMVEDDPNHAEIFQRTIHALADQRYQIDWVSSLGAGLEKLSTSTYDLVVLDLNLPDSNGLDTFGRVHAHAPEVPILIHTAMDDESQAVRAVRAGAQDYLVKGRAGSTALARVIRYSLERHRKQVDLWNQSLLDELTGLYNRRGLLAMAVQQQRVAKRNGSGLSLFFADLDGLKKINDERGHAEGDRALQAAAKALRQSFRDSDIVARLGGDEFVVLALDTQEKNAEAAFQRLQESLRAVEEREALGYPLSFSVGVVRAEARSPVTIEDLLSRADAAMYERKRTRSGAISPAG